MELLNKIHFTSDFINKRIGEFKADIAIQLGTGMTSGFSGLNIHEQIPYVEIPHFQKSTAPSHKGQMIFGTIQGKNIIILDGRFHYYEGYTMQEVVFPVYTMKYLGVQNLILTNASGSVDPELKEGDIVIITDHINLHHDNPLRGVNDETIGPRFPGMGYAYDSEVIKKIRHCALKEKILIKEGIYLGLSGPNFETPAEYRMARILGANIVGMSTIPEVLAANHCRLKVNAISLVSNQYDDAHPQEEAELEGVLNVVKNNSKDLMRLLISVTQSL